MLYLPQRNTENHDIEWDQSSLAAKYHFNIAATDIDLLAGKHYADDVAGIGLTGYLMDSAWRLDATYTRLNEGTGRSDFASVAASLDYS